MTSEKTKQAKSILVPDEKFRNLPGDSSTIELALSHNRRVVVLRDSAEPNAMIRFDQAEWKEFVSMLKQQANPANSV